MIGHEGLGCAGAGAAGRGDRLVAAVVGAVRGLRDVRATTDHLRQLLDERPGA
ncbi:MAG: hypothetical protein ACRDT0_02505 [Pseudonocardiaceae bacterium]